MGFYSDLSSLPSTAYNSSNSDSSQGHHQVNTTPRLTATLTAQNIETLSQLIDRTDIKPSPHACQSNSELLSEQQQQAMLTDMTIMVDTDSGGNDKPSPRLKQTNIPIMCSVGQPFDELVGVEFGADIASAYQTKSDDVETSEHSEVGMRHGVQF